jgi:hypothetical protein
MNTLDLGVVRGIKLNMLDSDEVLPIIIGDNEFKRQITTVFHDLLIRLI